MVSISQDTGTRQSFNEVLCQELAVLRPQATLPDPAPAAASDATKAENLRQYFQAIGGFADSPDAAEPLTALCLSGGGIRSATFNLGVVQRLAKIGLLGKIDYLSSVSGGGYVAGWLRAWMRREGVQKVVDQLANSVAGANRDPLKPDPAPVSALREYSNYLTPKLGLFSGDTWTTAAIVIRNLLLNWLILLPLVAAVLAIPLVFLLFVRGNPISPEAGGVLLKVSLGIELLASYLIHSSRRFLKEPGTSQAVFIVRCLVPIWVAAFFLAIASLGVSDALRTDTVWESAALWEFAAAWCIGAPIIGWGLTELQAAWLVARPRTTEPASSPTQDLRQVNRWYELWALLISGAIAAAILVCCVTGMYSDLYAHPALYVVLVNPTLLGIYLISRVLFVAVAGLGENAQPVGDWTPSDDDEDREWWARLSGWVLLLALAWLGVTALCLLGTYLPEFIARWIEPGDSEKLKQAAEPISGVVKWIVGAIGTLSGAVSAFIGTSPGSPVRNNVKTSASTRGVKVALSIAGPLFIVCVLIVLSWAVKALSDLLWGKPTLFDLPRDWHRGRLTTDSWVWVRFIAVPAALAALSALAGYIVNVNRFSLHGMYRNRLVRAYLGASNVLGNADEGRRPDPFTGFARSDNLSLADLWPHETRPLQSQAATSSLLNRVVKSALDAPMTYLKKKSASPANGRPEPSPLLPKDHPDIKQAAARRPLSIFNTTLNLVHGENLAWQERKAESFAMTPFYCGNVHEGFRASDKYGGKTGITVGNAITISGAAANPNMGYSSSPVLSFIMTLFNVRLGVWLGNTNQHGDCTYYLPGPVQAIKPLLAELFGLTNSARRYVNLSDGGHFDNLGLYEVVLRRCRRVLVSDADADASFQFENLGNAIRKIRIDFGINITFKAKILILPRDSADKGALYCAIANIGYRDIDGTQDGTLVYIKPTIHGRGDPVPYDVYSYSLANKTFPHESTVDQWFSESQFESYRTLGYHILEQLAPNLSSCDFKQFEEAVAKYVRGAVMQSSSAHDI